MRLRLFQKRLRNRQKHTVPNTQFCNHDNRTLYYSLVSRQTLGLASHYRMRNDGNIFLPFSMTMTLRFAVESPQVLTYLPDICSGDDCCCIFSLIHFYLIHFCLAPISNAKTHTAGFGLGNYTWSQKKILLYGFPLKLNFDSFLYENPHLTLAYALRHTHLLPSQWTHYAEQIRVFCIYRCSLLWIHRPLTHDVPLTNHNTNSVLTFQL